MKTNDKNTNSEVRAEPVAKELLPTLKLGLDVHADSIMVVRILDQGAPQPAQRFAPDKFLRWIKQQQKLARAVHTCYEAGPFGYGLHRALCALGVQNVVVQPVCLDPHHKGVNHDKSDARELALRLDRFVAGNSHALATVRVPTEEQERARTASRQREQFKREILRVSAQGRSLLLTQGHREKRTWWSARRWAGLRLHLESWLVERLEGFRRILHTLDTELKVLNAAIEKAAPACKPKGLGSLTYEIIEREVGDWQRFHNRRQVGSYTGLCGGLSASGNSRQLLPITKHGNVRLRTALVELAWRLVIWQRECKLVQKWWPILGQVRTPKGARKKAIVAIARQLAVDLWRWRTGRVNPETLGWKMTDLAPV